MAQKVDVQYVDDLDGSAASGPVEFGFRGKWYTIDLSDRNLQVLTENLADFIAAATEVKPNVAANGKAGKTRKVRTPGDGTAAAKREETQRMREWLRAQGYEVNERGRIKAELVELYQNAN